MAGIDPGSWKAVIQLAKASGVAPLLHQALQSSGDAAVIPQHGFAQLAEARRTTGFKNLRAYRELREVGAALARRGIPFVALKGLHLAERVYDDISLRPMSDLDLLLRESDLEQSVSALSTLGFSASGHAIAAARAMADTPKCNFGLRNPRTGCLIELHWALGEPAGRYADFTAEAWRCSEPARLGEAQARILSPAFLMVHVCAHLACSHHFLFSAHGLCDVAEIVHRHPALDWQAVERIARRYGLLRGVASVLRLARDHLGAAIPAEPLAALGCDELDPVLLELAMHHLFEDEPLPHDVHNAPNLLGMATLRNWRSAFSLAIKRILVPPQELSLLYGMPPGSRLAPYYYARRFSDLLRRHAGAAWAMARGGNATARAAERHARLAHWIGADQSLEPSAARTMAARSTLK